MPGLIRSLLGLGNPLLDVISDVDQAFLDKYKVKPLLGWRAASRSNPVA